MKKLMALLIPLLFSVSVFADRPDVATCTLDLNLGFFQTVQDTVKLNNFTQLEGTIEMSKKVCVETKGLGRDLSPEQIQAAVYDGIVAAARTAFGEENQILKAWIQARVPRLNRPAAKRVEYIGVIADRPGAK